MKWCSVGVRVAALLALVGCESPDIGVRVEAVEGPNVSEATDAFFDSVFVAPRADVNGVPLHEDWDMEVGRTEVHATLISPRVALVVPDRFEFGDGRWEYGHNTGRVVPSPGLEVNLNTAQECKCSPSPVLTA